MVEKILYLGARLVAALILFQTLYFKFGAAPESVYIFTTVGMEPWGRIGVGVAELIAVILLLLNRTAWLGAGLALGLMIGAIGMHFTLLGIEVQGDGGYWVVALCAAYVLVADRHRILAVFRRA
ncbi:MAG: DoxX family protein [Cyclobacteriaceae bacterium]|nr:DoxX family protein [Cyclobacteriaceae bacterium]